ncbi:DUF5317 family protein [Alicyclobacillus fastidiosus]|uniref:DUF5317 family protein n=1 Tax=Alicyclobacillus fastidiosus TaxID=392011 RepID=A0ABV5AE70_9BACL|nr:DUF5317 family protein [Alicyclobacillus fastidiosus]WEH08813.1 DUF5317 family protein [Alicyclobacillus fastidiosus]
MPYFVILGIILSVISGRHLSTLLQLRFKQGWLMIGGLVSQLILNSLPVSHGITGPWILDLCFSIFIVGLFFNWHIRGVRWIAIGACLNLFIIVLHGGAMPVSLGAFHALHPHGALPHVGSRHVMTSQAVGWWLADWIPVPPFLMSPGDIIVGLGIIVLVYSNSSKRGAKDVVQN